MSLGAKIRETRENSGISLRKLAKNVGVSPSFISQVEQSKANPSVDSLKSIADQLGVSCSYLIGETTEVEITEKSVLGLNRFQLDRLNNISVKRLAPENIENKMEPTLLTIQPGGTAEDHQHPDGEEFLLLLSGELTINLNGKDYALKEGDNIYFSSSLKHHFKNNSNSVTKVLWIKNS